MAPLSDYVSGTITLTNGSAAFTGSGTGWLAASFREGDTILGIEDNPGVTYVIESITDNDAGTLTQPWDGPSGTYEYRMRYLADGQRVTAQARTLIELLGNGNLAALAGLSGTPQTLPMFTGTGAMVEVPRTDLESVDQLFTDDLTAEFDANEKAQARENIDALGPGESPDRAFRRGNILGTVSQSGGVPTGAIIERGSNANGEYVRYADGTQICWKSETIIVQDVAATAPWDWTFPAAFGSPPVPTSGFQPVNVSGSNRRFVLISTVITETTAHLVVTVLSGQTNFTSGDELRIDGAAHGRWF